VKREDGSDLDISASPQAKRRRVNSRTPSRTPPSSRGSSPDLRRRRDSDSDSEGGRFLSRSPSVSDDGEEGDTRPRYVSRSPSISPDRVMAAEGEDGERIDGDV
jgi:pre-mRNA-splicing factor 38A